MTVVTHKYLKNLYFEYKNDENSVNLSEEDVEDIQEYLDRIEEFKHKRNWKGADDADSHARMFAKRLINRD